MLRWTVGEESRSRSARTLRLILNRGPNGFDSPLADPRRSLFSKWIITGVGLLLAGQTFAWATLPGPPAGAAISPGTTRPGQSPSPVANQPGDAPGVDAADEPPDGSPQPDGHSEPSSPDDRMPGFVAPGRVQVPPPTREQCQRMADYSAKLAGRAVLVRHAGRVIFERYDRDWTATRPHPLASGTKSFTGVLAMLAVQEGLLSLDERACDTLTEWRDDPRKSQITVRHLLTLSSGLEPGDRELGGRAGAGGVLGEGAARRARRLGLSANGPRPENLNAVALALPTKSDPGMRFDYGPSHFYAFSELLERKLAKSGGADTTTLAYLQNRLLRPLGITPFRIGRDRQGHPNLPGGMVLTAFEWSHFGEFVLNRGWVGAAERDGRELLRSELLAECFQPSRANPRYGLTWWLKSTDGVADGEADSREPTGQAPTAAEPSRRNVGSRLPQRQRGGLGSPRRTPFQNERSEAVDVWMAAGLGKQRLYVVPARDLVVVRFAEAATEGQRFDDAEFLQPILSTPRTGDRSPDAPRGTNPESL